MKMENVYHTSSTNERESIFFGGKCLPKNESTINVGLTDENNTLNMKLFSSRLK